MRVGMGYHLRMSLENIRVVLVRPLYGGNVGSVCRAMMNMGLSRLALVAPRADLRSDETLRMALHAHTILDQALIAPTLAEAVADCTQVAGTSARQGLYRSHCQLPRDWAPGFLSAAASGPVALVFGPEDSGLQNEDLALCTQIIQIPSAPEYTSLNLAQAVMVCGYELYQASGQFEPLEEFSDPAPSAMRERMFSIWREVLLEIGFMKEDKAEHMMMGLRRILSRGAHTENDVHIMMGVARQAQWAAHNMASRKKEGNIPPSHAL